MPILHKTPSNKPKKPRILSEITPIPPVTDLQLACLRTLDRIEKARDSYPLNDPPNYPEKLAKEVEIDCGATPRTNSSSTYHALIDLVIKKCLTKKTDTERLGQGRRRIRFTIAPLGSRTLLYNISRDIKLINGGFFKKGAAIKKSLD